MYSTYGLLESVLLLVSLLKVNQLLDLVQLWINSVGREVALLSQTTALVLTVIRERVY